MKKSTLLVIILLLATSLVFSQAYRGKGRIKGKVTDENDKPLEGVKIKLFSMRAGSGFDLGTNASGEWVANYIRGGSWNLDFEKFGYETRRISINIPEATQNPPVDVKLKKTVGLMITEDLKAALKAGNELFGEKKFGEAAKAYEDIIAKNPDAYIIYKNVGNSYFELQQYDKAEAAYLKVLEKDPVNSDILLLIGNCYANRGDGDKAMEWYNKIDFEKISDPAVLYNIGTSFTKQAKHEEALKYYKRSVEIQKDFLDGLYELGLTYLALGKNAEAIPPFEEYLKVDPDSARATQVKSFLDFLKKK